jgi:poly(A) polymerase
MPAAELRPNPLITGKDLIDAGFAPGPGFGVALREVEDAQMENRIATRDEALEIARRMLQK